MIQEICLFMCVQCQKIYLYQEKFNTEVKKCMLIFQADKYSETEAELQNVFFFTRTKS